MHRKPVVAGIFYQENKKSLINQIENLFKHEQGPGIIPDREIKKTLEKSYGLVLPHAGYVYSGCVAAWGMTEAHKKGLPKTVVLLGPSHTGLGMPVSVWNKGDWETPLGNLEIDSELAEEFLKSYDYAKPSYESHLGEHSLEVQLPLLQYVFDNNIKILPISIMDQRKKTALEIGQVFAKLKEIKPILFIASSDLNHYEPEEETQIKDNLVIQNILNNDTCKLYSIISEQNISMCGFGPVAVLMNSDLGSAKLLKHTTSAAINGDYSHVVGYSSLIVDHDE